MLFWNLYHCKDCDLTWSDVWNCQCDDKCPQCNKAYTPEKSEEVTTKDLIFSHQTQRQKALKK